MKTIHKTLLALALAVAGTTSAYAHDSVGFSLHIGGAPGYYYGGPPVIYAPPPAIYYEPAPIYYRHYSPRPNVRYYEPRYRYDYRHDYGRHHGGHKHRWHDRHH
ncbi:MAG TPA: hypothetical protein VFF74_05395 [Methylophilaceae bacterium]|nr:hypothetical protein [Methylophilaceae bacterium]